MKSPNLIFIVLDTLRADRFPPNSSKKFLTPFINDILDNSIFFKNCIANTAWTLPSHISMFTGLYSTQTSILSGQVDRISTSTPILAQILKDLGYFTICYSENVYISKIFGLTRGFDVVNNLWMGNWWLNSRFELFPIINTLNKFEKIIRKKIKSVLITKTWSFFKKTSERIIKFLGKTLLFSNTVFRLKNNTLNELEHFSRIIKNKSNNQPLFMFFNFLTPHDPYIPLKKSMDLLKVPFKKIREIKDIIFNPLSYRIKVNLKSCRLSNKKIDAVEKLYDASIHSSDIVIEKLFNILESLKILDNAYVIITSDHGEYLGNVKDHELWEHCTYVALYEGVLRVPLLIYNKKYHTQEISDQVQLKDLFHTFLHLTGISENENKFFNLKNSLIYQITNNTTPDYIFGEFLKYDIGIRKLVKTHYENIKKDLIPTIINPIYFLRTNNYKYIVYENIGKEEFYNLEDDPYEKINLIYKNKKESEIMKKNMDEILSNIQNKYKLMDLITKGEKDALLRGIKKIFINQGK